MSCVYNILKNRANFESVARQHRVLGRPMTPVESHAVETSTPPKVLPNFSHTTIPPAIPSWPQPHHLMANMLSPLVVRAHHSIMPHAYSMPSNMRPLTRKCDFPKALVLKKIAINNVQLEWRKYHLLEFRGRSEIVYRDENTADMEHYLTILKELTKRVCVGLLGDLVNEDEEVRGCHCTSTLRVCPYQQHRQKCEAVVTNLGLIDTLIEDWAWRPRG